VIQKLQEKLFILKGRTVALLGLAFKPYTDDLRDAPSIQIAERLLHMGARVRVFDPIAMDACRAHYPHLQVCYCNDALSATTGADAAVLVTEWPEFADLDLAQVAWKMRRPVLIDGRNLFDPEKAVAAGFEYTGVGRSSRTSQSKPQDALVAARQSPARIMVEAQFAAKAGD
jgi:UDPglucose 6-dehydrogenase